ncbi:hypothetical protein J6590_097191, partial [Homalodisca vitripennis]
VSVTDLVPHNTQPSHYHHQPIIISTNRDIISPNRFIISSNRLVITTNQVIISPVTSSLRLTLFRTIHNQVIIKINRVITSNRVAICTNQVVTSAGRIVITEPSVVTNEILSYLCKVLSAERDTYCDTVANRSTKLL